MIVIYEEGTLRSRYFDNDYPYGVRTIGDEDQEEWFGIRCQLIAVLLGWGL